jgi:hypothetical protein
MEALLDLLTSGDEPLRIFSILCREVVAFGAETQFFVCSATLKYFAIWPVFASTATAFSSHVITAGTAVKQTRSCQGIKTHNLSLFWLFRVKLCEVISFVFPKVPFSINLSLQILWLRFYLDTYSPLQVRLNLPDGLPVTTLLQVSCSFHPRICYVDNMW